MSCYQCRLVWKKIRFLKQIWNRKHCPQPLLRMFTAAVLLNQNAKFIKDSHSVEMCWERVELQQACAASATLPTGETKTKLDKADCCKSRISSLVQAPFAPNELYLNCVT